MSSLAKLELAVDRQTTWQFAQASRYHGHLGKKCFWIKIPLLLSESSTEMQITQLRSSSYFCWCLDVNIDFYLKRQAKFVLSIQEPKH